MCVGTSIDTDLFEIRDLMSKSKREGTADIMEPWGTKLYTTPNPHKWQNLNTVFTDYDLRAISDRILSLVRSSVSNMDVNTCDAALTAVHRMRESYSYSDKLIEKLKLPTRICYAVRRFFAYIASFFFYNSEDSIRIHATSEAGPYNIERELLKRRWALDSSSHFFLQPRPVHQFAPC